MFFIQWRLEVRKHRQYGGVAPLPLFNPTNNRICHFFFAVSYLWSKNVNFWQVLEDIIGLGQIWGKFGANFEREMPQKFD